MERNVITQGIVLSSVRSGTVDRTLRILSEDLGVIDVRNYGARKANKAVKAEVSTEGTFYLYVNPVKHSYTLTDIAIRSMHETLRQDLSTTYTALFFSEFILKTNGGDWGGDVPVALPGAWSAGGSCRQQGPMRDPVHLGDDRHPWAPAGPGPVSGLRLSVRTRRNPRVFLAAYCPLLPEMCYSEGRHAASSRRPPVFVRHRTDALWLGGACGPQPWDAGADQTVHVAVRRPGGGELKTLDGPVLQTMT
jgi:hypothetical protein